MGRGVVVGLWALAVAGSARGQERTVRIGAELQAYPAGVITAAKVGLRTGPFTEFALYGGYNLTDRRGWGEHESEQGNGTGFGFAWAGWSGAGHSDWAVGGRFDVWSMTIDWEDNGGADTGASEITVFQPTLRAGRSFSLGSAGYLDLLAGIGSEINIRTEGEEVGDGMILLIGVGAGVFF